jgi:hypothetical protein
MILSVSWFPKWVRWNNKISLFRISRKEILWVIRNNMINIWIAWKLACCQKKIKVSWINQSKIFYLVNSKYIIFQKMPVRSTTKVTLSEILQNRFSAIRTEEKILLNLSKISKKKFIRSNIFMQIRKSTQQPKFFGRDLQIKKKSTRKMGHQWKKTNYPWNTWQKSHFSQIIIF